MTDIGFRVRGTLLDKEVKINGKMEKVYGLRSLDISPRRAGLGSYTLEWMVEFAKRQGRWGIVAFTSSRTWVFYRKRDWCRHGEYEGQVVITSEPCESIEVTERW